MTKRKKTSNVLWAFKEAMKFDCPACTTADGDPVGVGDPCVDHRGEPLTYPCLKRVAFYRESIGEEDFAARHSRPWPIHKKEATQ